MENEKYEEKCEGWGREDWLAGKEVGRRSGRIHSPVPNEQFEFNFLNFVQGTGFRVCNANFALCRIRTARSETHVIQACTGVVLDKRSTVITSVPVHDVFLSKLVWPA